MNEQMLNIHTDPRILHLPLINGPKVVWRGALTAGPPPGVAAVQRCGSATGASLSKLFRGLPGSLFVPGLPWKCRGRYTLTTKKKG